MGALVVTFCVGELVGCVGLRVGNLVGAVGLVPGLTVGRLVGLAVVGFCVGAGVGESERHLVGESVGSQKHRGLPVHDSLHGELKHCHHKRHPPVPFLPGHPGIHTAAGLLTLVEYLRHLPVGLSQL